ncbi:MAG: hypothetical protein JWO06_1269 [Bacteroidota bacterium]|nr:hypothetical protein [Bacteroidota bacterium]
MKTTSKIVNLAFLGLFAHVCNVYGNSGIMIAPTTEHLSGNKFLYIDSLSYNGKSVYLQQIDRDEFYNLPGTNFNWIDSIFAGKHEIDDKENIHLYDTIIKQKFEKGDELTDSSASVLVLKFKNGKSIELVSLAMLEPVGYMYEKQITDLNSYLICHYYEQYSDYALFNKASGKESFLCGYPFVAPGKKIFCSYQNPCDGCRTGDYCSSEFLVYAVEGDSINLLWENPVKWVPTECKWKDNRTLYIRIQYGWMEGEVYYVELRFPEFEKQSK